MRRRFGKVISELATKDEKIVLIVGDIGYGVFDDFRKEHPKKFFNLGICEQSIIGLAAGMAFLRKGGGANAAAFMNKMEAMGPLSKVGKVAGNLWDGIVKIIKGFLAVLTCLAVFLINIGIIMIMCTML